MNERPNPKKFAPQPEPRWQTSRGLLVAAIVPVVAFFALLGFWWFG
jgi:hypothetical protein